MADGPWQNFSQQQPTTTPTQAPWTGFGDQQEQPAAAEFRRPSATPPAAVAGTVEEWMAANPPPLDATEWGRQTGAGDLSPQELDAAFRQSNPDAAAAYDAWTKQFTSFLNERQIPALSGDPMSQGEMAGRTFLQGATLGLADDAARLFGNDQWAMEQERGTEMYRETSPINAGIVDLIGNATTALPLGFAAALPRTVGGRVAAGTALGAAEGGAAGFGYQDSSTPIAQRIAQSVPLAALGAAGGRLGVEGATQVAQPPPMAPGLPSVEPNPQLAAPLGRDLGVSPPPATATPDTMASPSEAYREASRSLYNDIDNLGVVFESVGAGGLDQALDALAATARREAGADLALTNYAGVRNIVARVEAMKNGPQTYSDLENLRQAISAEIRATTNDNERRILSQMRGELADYVTGNPSTYSLSGATAQNASDLAALARQNWFISEKIDVLDEMVYRIENTGSTVRTEMRRILRNKDLRRMFEPEELRLMSQLANEDNRGVAARLMSLIGRFAPNSLGGILGITSSIATGNLGPLVPLVAGAAARGAASGQTTRLFDDVYRSVAGQTPLSPVPMLRQGAGAGIGILAAPQQ